MLCSQSTLRYAIGAAVFGVIIIVWVYNRVSNSWNLSKVSAKETYLNFVLIHVEEKGWFDTTIHS